MIPLIQMHCAPNASDIMLSVSFSVGGRYHSITCDECEMIHDIVEV